MNFTKPQLKKLIIEVAGEHSLDLGLEGAHPPLEEQYGLSDVDEEEEAEWRSMIEDDVLALRETLENAPEQLLTPRHQRLLAILNKLVKESGEPFDAEEDHTEEAEDIE